MRWHAIAWLRLALTLASLTWAADASAQSTVRVLTQQAIIWQSSFLTPAAVVPKGTELEVIGVQGTWYEVRVPSSVGTAAAATGFVASTQVELVSGESLPKPVDIVPPPAQRPPPPRRNTARFAPPGPYGFGQFGYGPFTATKSFDAIFGDHQGVWFGGGGEYRFRSGLFAGAAVDRFKRTGDRVFVANDGEVFNLGIEETLTLTPLYAFGGYRVPNARLAPYAAGGVGRYFLSEVSPIAEASENVKQQSTSYHFLFGVEWHFTPRVATGFELQYTLVPNALEGPVGVNLNEDDLGGIQFRGKILFR
jgi:opacity protein-like surface antigen